MTQEFKYILSADGQWRLFHPSMSPNRNWDMTYSDLITGGRRVQIEEVAQLIVNKFYALNPEEQLEITVQVGQKGSIPG